MTFEIIGLIIWVILLGFAMYMYRYSQGWYISKLPAERQDEAKKWLKKNGTWMRYLSIAMAAIMAVNIFFSLGALGVF